MVPAGRPAAGMDTRRAPSAILGNHRHRAILLLFLDGVGGVREPRRKKRGPAQRKNVKGEAGMKERRKEGMGNTRGERRSGTGRLTPWPGGRGNADGRAAEWDGGN